MPRLFIGFELPRVQADALAALAEPAPALRWQTPAQLHLTLRFLGEMSNAQSCEVQQALSVLCWQALGISAHKQDRAYSGLALPITPRCMRCELNWTCCWRRCWHLILSTLCHM